MENDGDGDGDGMLSVNKDTDSVNNNKKTKHKIKEMNHKRSKEHTCIYSTADTRHICHHTYTLASSYMY